MTLYVRMYILIQQTQTTFFESLWGKKRVTFKKTVKVTKHTQCTGIVSLDSTLPFQALPAKAPGHLQEARRRRPE